MKIFKRVLAIMLFMVIYSGMVLAQEVETVKSKKDTTALAQQTMKTYVIERDVPDAGKLTAEDLKAISQTSCNILNNMDQNNIQWLHSYVTENKVFCVYRAKNEELIKKHAEKGKFACTSINQLANIISPITAQ